MTIQTTTGPLTLEYVKTVGLTHNGPRGRGFGHPVGLVIGKDGRIFVLNRGFDMGIGASAVGWLV